MAYEREVSGSCSGISKGNHHYDTAVAIVAELPEVVDPDIAVAEDLAGIGPLNRTELALAAIRRGRALERGE
jgi:hypothetical protein